MTFTTYQIADISTFHVTAKDGALLGDPDCPALLAHIGLTRQSPGTILYVELTPEVFANDVAEWRAAGFSEAFIAIMSELSRQGVPYVRFDCDSAIMDGVPTFDW